MDANTGKMLVDRAAYAAEMERRFKETASTSKWYGEYQARKAASDARKRAAEIAAAAESTSSPEVITAPVIRTASVAEKNTAEKTSAASEAAVIPRANSASSPEVIDSDSDGAEASLSTWQPRKKPFKNESTQGSSSAGNAPPINEPPINEGSTPAATTTKLPAKPSLSAAISRSRLPSVATSARAKAAPRHPSSTSVKAEDVEKLAKQAKRPAETDQTDRRPSAAKKARESSTASSSSGSPALPIRLAGAEREPPAWYKQLPKPKGDRARNQSDAEVAILRLKAHINRVMAAHDKQAALAKEGKEIVERLHALIFLPVDGKLLRQTRVLDNKDGLPQLFDPAFTNGIDWPFYLKADAEELYNKWYTGEFETDLYRGIVRGLPTKKGKGKGKDASVADRLAEGHQRFRLMDPKQHGNGLLQNGTWFPSQLAILRDGGHGASQGGITGTPTSGAYSVIMAGGVDPSGQPYPNEDRGSEVLYCGTDNTKPLNQPSPDTASLLTNHRTKQPVRLFRSHNLDSPFAPELGFRYDGLYDVASYEDMDPPENKRRRHRFRLVRRAGQDPIRSEGAAKRPTKQEIDEYEKDRKNRGR